MAETAAAAAATDEERVIAFLRGAPERRAAVASLAHACRIASCFGRAGAYGRWLRARSHLFSCEDDGNVVRLIAAVAAAPPPPPAAADAADSDEARIVAFLRRAPERRAAVALVGHACRIASCAGRAGAYGRWFRARGHLFALESNGSIARLVDAAAPPPSPAAAARARQGLGGVAGCPLCEIPCFTSANQRGQHEAGSRHQVTLAAARRALECMGLAPSGAAAAAAPAHGLTMALVGADAGGAAQAELAAAPGASACAALCVTNAGSHSWLLLEGDVLLLPRGGGDLHVAATGAALPPGASVRVPVRYAPASAGTTTVLASLGLRASGGSASVVRVGCAVRLRCADPATAADIASMQPTAPYTRARRSARERWGEAAERAPRLPGGAGAWRPPDFPAITSSSIPDDFVAALAASVGEARLHKLLQCEEHQARKDMEEFDMAAARLTASGSAPWLYLLEVPGLAESRPSVAEGDTVAVRRAPGSAVFRARVVAVARTTLSLAFGAGGCRAVAAGGLWNVRFELRRAPFLVQHAAITGEGDDKTVAAAVTAPPPRERSSARDAAVAFRAARLPVPLHFSALNPQQRLAVAGALHPVQPAEEPQPAFIVFGPPGTGKTTMLCEYIMQVIGAAKARGAEPGVEHGGGGVGGLAAALAGLQLSGAGVRRRQPPPADTLVLVAAPSNAAVDVLALRLLKAGLPPASLLRANAYKRSRASIPAELLQCSPTTPLDEGFQLPERAALARAWVVAATCATAQRLVRTLQLAGSAPLFSHVVIDEAGQATEPECLCAIAGAMRSPAGAPGVGRVVLAGDPHQLGPVLRSPLALAHGLGVSLLERLMAGEGEGAPHRAASGERAGPQAFDPAFVCMLTDNYRSHPALIAVPNALFYDDALQAAAGASATSLAHWPGLTEAARRAEGGCPLLFHGVQGQDMQEGNNPSFFNPEEAIEVLGHIKSVLAFAAGALTAADIGVVTPYAKQRLKLHALLARSPELKGVTVGSVEQFQGGERRVIVVSTVRASRELLSFDAKHALGFLDNPKRFNVAVTRARHLLIIVGDPAILALDSSWGALLRYAVDRGAYRGAPLPPGFEEGRRDGLLERLRAAGAGGDDDDADGVRGAEAQPPPDAEWWNHYS